MKNDQNSQKYKLGQVDSAKNNTKEKLKNRGSKRVHRKQHCNFSRSVLRVWFFQMLTIFVLSLFIQSFALTWIGFHWWIRSLVWISSLEMKKTNYLRNSHEPNKIKVNVKNLKEILEEKNERVEVKKQSR